MTGKKVLFLLPSFAGGGAERTVLNLLRTNNSSSLEIKVCLVSNSGSYLWQVPTSAVFSHPKAHKLFEGSTPNKVLFMLFRLLPFLRKIIREFEPEVIVTVTESMNYLGYFLRRRGITKNVKWVVRSGNNIFAEAHSKGPIIRNILNFLLKLSYRKADHVIAISQGGKRSICENFSLDNSAISTIYNPIDIDQINRLSNENDASPFSQPYFLGIGRLAKQKRFDKMIKIFASSGLQDSDYILVILGQGPQLKSLKRLAEDLGVAKHVFFPGFQKNPYHFLKHAEAFLLTSEWEGFAHVVAEALACDTTVISMDCDFGPKEILEDGQYGNLIERDDFASFTKALIDKVEAKTNSFQGVKRAAEFDVKVITRKYQNLFQSIVEI